MHEIQLSDEQKQAMTEKLKTWLAAELSVDIGQFDAEFLLEFISSNFGAQYYNQGLHDARAIFQGRLEAIDEDIYAMEKDT